MTKKAEPQDAREYKTLEAFAVKMDVDQGIVEHLVSVFGVLDLGGDVTHKGAFTKTISERAGDIRVLDSHNRFSTKGVVGIPLGLREVSKVELPQEVLDKWPEATGGLMAETQFLLETTEGKDVFTRIKAGAVKEFSFAYDALDHDYEKIQIEGKDVTVRNLRTVRLWEYGPVVFGMNRAALAVSAKSAEELELEAKPAPDVTENTIRIRVKDPKGFQKDSFRTIRIGKKGDGIQAVIGRLEGETSTTIQSYIFDKSKWTTEKARKWVAAHGKKAFDLARLIDAEWVEADYALAEPVKKEVSLIALTIEQALSEIALVTD